MISPHPLLSIIIVNFKKVELTLDCLKEIEEQIPSISKQVIVVDNSSMETANIIRKAGGFTDIIENKKNHGFAKAVNQGIEISSGEYILLLNNDAFINQECIQAGMEYLSQHVEVGLWAPKLLGTNGEPQVSFSKFPNLVSLIGEYLFRKHLDWYPGWREWKNPTKVDSIVGAFHLIPRRVIQKVGYLDECFFFTAEDLDYCRRIHKASFDVIYDPRFSVVHIGGASQDHKKWVDDPHLHQSRIIYFNKYYHPWVAFIAKYIITTGIKLRKKIVK